MNFSFQSNCRITAKSVKVTDLSHNPYPHRTTSPISILHQCDTFFTISEPTETHYYHPESIVYIRVHSCYYYVFYCFEMYDMYLPLQYTRLVSFTPKNLLYSTCSSLSSCSPWQPLILVTVPTGFFFQNVMLLESYSM